MSRGYSWEDVPQTFSEDGVGEARAIDDGGGTMIQLEQYEPGFDPTFMYKGLPDDMCQCHHYGYVIEGSATFDTKEGELTLEAGQAYHLTPGHVPLRANETFKIVEFTDTDAFNATMEVCARNMQAVA